MIESELTKGEFRVGRDIRGSTALAVSLGCRDCENALSTNKHPLNAFVPALDDLAFAEGEEERLAYLGVFSRPAISSVGLRTLGVRVEHLSVFQTTDITHTDLLSGLGGGAYKLMINLLIAHIGHC
jgi:hypothetical protein